MAFKFENLEVWQRSLETSHKISELVKKFPKDELFVLTSQLKRSADSVSLNIAEGSTSQSNSEFNRFLSYALRSAIELVGALFLARKRKLIEENEFCNLYNEIEITVKMIQSLRKSVK